MHSVTCARGAIAIAPIRIVASVTRYTVLISDLISSSSGYPKESHGPPITIVTLDRGRAHSTFPGEIIFSTASFVLISFPVRIFSERATALSCGSRPSHFCFSARDDLFQHKFFSKTFRNADSQVGLILTRVVCLLASKLVYSSRAVVTSLPPYPFSHRNHVASLRL